MLPSPTAPKSGGANARAENAKDKGRTQQRGSSRKFGPAGPGKALEMGVSLVAQLERTATVA
jgi:hypothetical protein